jgi:RNA polymerase sigma-70 factor (ECF subfamily)
MGQIKDAPPHQQQPQAARPDESRLLADLRNGDEAAFAGLVAMYHVMLLRLAMMYVKDRAVAEDVVQETWLGFLESLDRFEGRASIKTWIYRILVNTAKKRRAKDSRSIPFSSLADAGAEDTGALVEPERFRSAHERLPHAWKTSPADWASMPEGRLVSKETLMVVEQAIASLPPAQREVITMRDVEGWTSDEVCNALGITDTNQRVLLHRGRSKVRRALEKYFDEEHGTE